jgi:hypothetical protein
MKAKLEGKSAAYLQRLTKDIVNQVEKGMTEKQKNPIERFTSGLKDMINGYSKDSQELSDVKKALVHKIKANLKEQAQRSSIPSPIAPNAKTNTKTTSQGL